jgi:hypothetical protein
MQKVPNIGRNYNIQIYTSNTKHQLSTRYFARIYMELEQMRFRIRLKYIYSILKIIFIVHSRISLSFFLKIFFYITTALTYTTVLKLKWPKSPRVAPQGLTLCRGGGLGCSRGGCGLHVVCPVWAAGGQVVRRCGLSTSGGMSGWRCRKVVLTVS